MFRRLTASQLAFDVTLAVLCLLLRAAIPGFFAIWFVIAAMAAALALRRLSPGLALGVAWLGAIAQMLGGFSPDSSNLAILAVLYATGRYGTGIVRWAGLISAGVGGTVATGYVLFVAGGFAPALEGNRVAFVGSIALASSIAVLGLSWTLGLLVRAWSTARENRRGRVIAEQSVVVEQERNRIARDMHDVVAHSLAVVIAQADGARYAAAKHPEAVEESLATISATAR